MASIYVRLHGMILVHFLLYACVPTTKIRLPVAEGAKISEDNPMVGEDDAEADESASPSTEESKQPESAIPQQKSSDPVAKTLSPSTSPSSSTPSTGPKSANIPNLPGLPKIPVMLAVESSGFCIDIDGGTSQDSEIVQQKPCNGSKDQMIKLQVGTGDRVSFVNAATNKCLDIDHAEINEGVTIQLWECNNSMAQQWQLQKIDDTHFQVRSALDDKYCLDIDRSAPKSRAMAQLLICNGGDFQKFHFVANESGFVAQSPLEATLEEYCTPRVRVTVENSEGAKTVADLFGGSVADKIKEWSVKVCKNLYKDRKDAIPNVRVLHVYIQEKIEVGLAYVTGDGYKRTLMKISTPSFVDLNRQSRTEATFFLSGVVAHETTHVFQSLGDYGKFGGLVEGLADFVRLKVGFPDRGWRRDKTGNDWSAGYSKTGFFLSYIEGKSPDFIYKLNQDLSNPPGGSWNEGRIQSLTGKAVEQWWLDYQADTSCKETNFICGQNKLSLLAIPAEY